MNILTSYYFLCLIDSNGSESDNLNTKCFISPNE